ncbi:MAG: BatD family protein [Myroides sp.]|nr:BatD family protein [Myroides sp.]
MYAKHFIYTFLALFTSIATWAQFQFGVDLRDKSIGINQTTEVRFRMSDTKTENFTQPLFQDFEVLFKQNSSAREGNKIEEFVTFKLRPLKTGTLKVETASVECNGILYRTRPLFIEVKNEDVEKASNKSWLTASDSFDEMEKFLTRNRKYFEYEPVYKKNPDKKFHMVVKMRADSVFVNEVFAIEYGLFMKDDREKNMLPTVNFRKTPNYQDSLFYGVITQQQDVSFQRGPSYMDLDGKGRSYYYAPIVTFLIKPKKEEEIEVKPLEIELVTKDSVTNTVHNEILVSDSKTITAVLLKNQTKKFSGIFGNFDIKANVSQNLVKTNENIEITITIQGAGFLPEKIKSIFKPIIESNLKYSLKLKDDNAKDVFLNNVQETTIIYTFIPKEKGIYKIRPVDFSYFHIISNEYKTVSTEEIIIEAD